LQKADIAHLFQTKALMPAIQGGIKPYAYLQATIMYLPGRPLLYQPGDRASTPP
jgi:hypothetical protein